MKSKIVEAIGTATMSNKRWIKVGRNPVQEAMTNAIIEAHGEVDSIQNRDDLDDNAKREMIAKILDDKSIQDRMLAARKTARRSMEKQ